MRLRHRLLAPVAGLLAVAACGEARVAGEPVSAYRNPVIDADFPDPHVVRAGDWWYAFATGVVGETNIQVARSRDLVRWDMLGEALPERPDWQPLQMGLTWAPEVLPVGGRWVMHYTARDAERGLQCLTTAVADDPRGPYVDDSDGPLVCQVRLGGSIDSHPFVDADGRSWLFWKNDGNARGLDTRIWVQELAADLGSLLGGPIDTELRQSAPWHGALVEAPTVLRTERGYLMFYSANSYDSADYAMGWASAPEVTGPYTNRSPTPWVSSRGAAAGPGGQSVVTVPDGQRWLAYHAWDSSTVGYGSGGRRAMWLDPLDVTDGEPVLRGPTSDRQPAPARP